MHLILIRHGQPGWTVDGLGVADPELTVRGHRQAALMAAHLAGAGIDEIWVSPLVRAQQTAAPLVDATGIAATTRDWLAEARPPSLEGLPIERVREVFGSTRRRTVAQWWAGHLDGEPLDAFVRRIAGGLDATFEGRGGRLDRSVAPPLWRDIAIDSTICIVSHAGTTAAIMSHLLGIEQVPWAWERFYPLHASVTRLRTVAVSDGVIFSLRGFSLTDHLAANDQTI